MLRCGILVASLARLIVTHHQRSPDNTHMLSIVDLPCCHSLDCLACHFTAMLLETRPAKRKIHKFTNPKSNVSTYYTTYTVRKQVFNIQEMVLDTSYNTKYTFMICSHLNNVFLERSSSIITVTENYINILRYPLQGTCYFILNYMFW